LDAPTDTATDIVHGTIKETTGDVNQQYKGDHSVIVIDFLTIVIIITIINKKGVTW